MLTLSVVLYLIIRKYLWVIDISTCILYVLSALLVTVSNLYCEEAFIPLDVQGEVSCNLVLHIMQLYLLLFNSNYVLSQYFMVPASLIFWIVNSIKLSPKLIAPYTFATILMVFFCLTVNYEQFLTKTELFLAQSTER
jgi:hypothetical protein